ncbi:MULTISPECIES: hypothetical protein [Bacillales]|jgi:hypothetical protein|uniref:Transcriptional regulator n=1 Tax=Brevibacillus aydinogluensis TaxID=927786 RepID=A0AA48MAX3_9BACL|nr:MULTISPECIES: hypothetical protein [Bacillales]REK62249.1 MAG: hypothetical protein DF221_13175 [Brevibacillus sp.]MBR8658577.1 hypothetical protein [Brevibacillus sp. NL20B1]MDT3415353.1 hypothetical protein [Brevibacillus aydinogluensis]NNV02169.1 hypothetical protein [Brevibacillus sp. MCWH]UFJ60440.1 hypothetical protein IRT44_14280 [Anoxybacillus sediminis]
MSARIVAVVTTNKEHVAGGVPVFVVPSRERMQQTAFTLEKVMDAMVHELDDETLIVVRHN